MNWRKLLWWLPQRVDLCFVSYSDADRLIRAGWTLAPEEDNNSLIGMVWLEKLERGQ